MQIGNLWLVVKRAWSAWWDDNAPRLAASLAFYSALSLAPLILLIVGVVGLVVERREVAGELATRSEGLMGLGGRQLVDTILTTSTPQQSTVTTLIGLVALLIGATAVFVELHSALNLVWNVQPVPALEGFWGRVKTCVKQRLASLALVFALALLLLASVVISAALAGAQLALLGRVLELVLSVPVLTLVFALLFRYVPDARIRWRDVWLGGAVSAVLFTLGKTAIGYYVVQASVGSAHGAAGSLVVLLVWIYYSALILFYGAEFTQAWAGRHRVMSPKFHAAPGVAP